MPTLATQEETCVKCANPILPGTPLTWRRRGAEPGPLHPGCVTRARGSASGYIAKVGVELEGAWPTMPGGAEYDGSVGPVHDRRERQAIADSPSGSLWWGELPSPGQGMAPHLVRDWIIDHYPTLTNRTCGLHVHVSFRTVREYARLMAVGADLAERIISNLREWATRVHMPQDHPLWDRLAGGNHYCGGEIRPDIQAQQTHKTGARYAAVNFCWSLHRTIEVRVLPGFRYARTAATAVGIVLATIETMAGEVARNPVTAMLDNPTLTLTGTVTTRGVVIGVSPKVPIRARATSSYSLASQTRSIIRSGSRGAVIVHAPQSRQAIAELLRTFAQHIDRDPSRPVAPPLPMMESQPTDNPSQE